MVAVISSTGKKLMPTLRHRARQLLKKGRAKIVQRRPFTIMILDREDGDVQPIEFKEDTGYLHIGVSICSEKREFISEQRDLLLNETEHHNDRRKCRRTRRNRLRYRQAKFNNRKGIICKDGFTPSIRNKRDRHVDIFTKHYDVMPITAAYIEMGEFDTRVLKAIQEGKSLPVGEDYQHGEQYGFETLRKAVFTRDGYKCIICKRSPQDGVYFHEHHIGYWKPIPDRSNRMSNLGTVCNLCHTSKNHKPEGKLYGLEPNLKSMASATFMTMVRFDMFAKFKEIAPDVEFHTTYGAATKLSRKDLHIKKTHANDAYAMGKFHPKHKTDTIHYQKVRRNNRILEKFYDAKYIDSRDGSKKSGSQIGCNRTKRNIPRNNPENLRIYHGQKIQNGKRVIRIQRYAIRPKDRVLITGKWYATEGMHKKGTYLIINKKSVALKKVQQIIHVNGWAII